MFGLPLFAATTTSQQALLDIPILAWVVFIAAVIAMLLLDLFVINRKHEVPTIRKATIQSLGWISIGILTGLILWMIYGGVAGAEYFTGYVIEKSLSVDNIFVWSVVLGFFAIPGKYRHRILFWGVFGALILRFIFISAGVTLIENFEPMVLILGAVLIWSAIKLVRDGDDEMDVSESRSYKFFTKYIPTTKKLDGAKFFSRIEGPLKATPLFLCLLVVEVTDVIFAVDSVPAILAVARDPFIIFASNAMAILGLRSLYFLFDAIKDKFSRLNQGLAIILGGIGVKMILASDMHIGPLQMPGIHIPTWISLVAIFSILAASVIASIKWPKEEN